jgi:hypothetical protein
MWMELTHSPHLTVGSDISGVQHLRSIAKALEQRRSENATVELGLQINNKLLTIPF